LTKVRRNRSIPLRSLLCYEAPLNNLSVARKHLAQAIAPDPSLAHTAFTDPDLRPIQTEKEQ
jgi:hypothetical protein